MPSPRPGAKQGDFVDHIQFDVREMRYSSRMMLNRILKREQAPGARPGPQRGDRDRRFEALYMQSFVEMRARSPKG